jgi:hypothetical protein
MQCNAAWQRWLQPGNDATTTFLAWARTALPLTLLSASAFFLSLRPRPFETMPDMEW